MSILNSACAFRNSKVDYEEEFCLPTGYLLKVEGGETQYLPQPAYVSWLETFYQEAKYGKPDVKPL